MCVKMCSVLYYCSEIIFLCINANVREFMNHSEIVTEKNRAIYFECDIVKNDTYRRKYRYMWSPVEFAYDARSLFQPLTPVAMLPENTNSAAATDSIVISVDVNPVIALARNFDMTAL